jgi:hypothetical protein
MFKPRHYAFLNASSSKREIALLPNDDVLPTADVFYQMLRGKPLAEWCSLTRLGPKVSLFPVPIFGVNCSRMPPATGQVTVGVAAVSITSVN